jgi:hypothetical protein
VERATSFRSLLAMMHSVLLWGFALLAPASMARDIPGNVNNFYNRLKSNGDCSNKLATGFYGTATRSNSMPTSTVYVRP